MTTAASRSTDPPTDQTPRPQLGFLGVGWIGRTRMQALAGTGLAEVAAIAEPDAALREQALAAAPRARGCSGLEQLLAIELDGIVIATPSALHAEQAIQALERGVAVFCQKPLGRDAAETQRVIDAARTADRLLGVDLSYRHLAAVGALQARLGAGELGRIYAADLTFHNAYGPDKLWFTQRSRSGGGCLIDLGTHLLDLVLWLTGATDADVRTSVLLRAGSPLSDPAEAVEDFAITQLRLNTGVEVRLTCSWFLPAGRDCVIELTLYGTDGAAAVHNVGGSFHDFRAEHWRGTRTEVLVEPPDDWGARALADWTRRLTRARSFDPAVDGCVITAAVLDKIYRCAA